MRPIDADAFRDNLNDEYEMGVTDPTEAVSNALDATPTLDYAPVVHAHWVGHFEDDGYSAPGQWRCSLCGAMAGLKEDGNHAVTSPFCPYCGAKMDGDSE